MQLYTKNCEMYISIDRLCEMMKIYFFKSKGVFQEKKTALICRNIFKKKFQYSTSERNHFFISKKGNGWWKGYVLKLSYKNSFDFKFSTLELKGGLIKLFITQSIII